MDMHVDVRSGTDADAKVANKLSVIIPIAERYDDIFEIYGEYKDALSKTGFDYEIIAVMDGDFPRAYRHLKSLKEKGENLTIIKHGRPFGEATAITSGFRKSTGNLIMILPAYHQVDAADLPKLMEAINGCDMVVARRWPRTDSKWNRIQTKFFHSIVSLLAGSVSSDLGCGVRVLRREILEDISLYGDLHRFLPIISHRQGFKVIEVELRQSEKEKHFRTYPFGVYVRRMIDLLTVFFLIKFTKKPLRFFGLTGTTVLVIGFAITLFLVISRLFFGVGLSDRPLFLMGILFIVLGLQIFAIGLIGEIIIFTHAKDIKDYNIEEIIN